MICSSIAGPKPWQRPLMALCSTPQRLWSSGSSSPMYTYDCTYRTAIAKGLPTPDLQRSVVRPRADPARGSGPPPPPPPPPLRTHDEYNYYQYPSHARIKVLHASVYCSSTTPVTMNRLPVPPTADTITLTLRSRVHFERL